MTDRGDHERREDRNRFFLLMFLCSLSPFVAAGWESVYNKSATVGDNANA